MKHIYMVDLTGDHKKKIFIEKSFTKYAITTVTSDNIMNFIPLYKIPTLLQKYDTLSLNMKELLIGIELIYRTGGFYIGSNIMVVHPFDGLYPQGEEFEDGIVYLENSDGNFIPGIFGTEKHEHPYVENFLHDIVALLENEATPNDNRVIEASILAMISENFLRPEGSRFPISLQLPSIRFK